MADSPQQLLQSLATAGSLTPFAQQLQAMQQLSQACRSRYSSDGTDMPADFPSQQQLEAHCAATSNSLQKLALLLQQWYTSSSTNPSRSSGSSSQGDSTSSTSTTTTTAAPNSTSPSSSGDTAGHVLPPQQLSSAALQAVLLLTDATRHTIDAMRKLVTVKARGGFAALMAGAGSAQAPSLQDFVAGIASTGLISSFCTACDALAATITRHPHLKPAPGLTQQQLHTLQQLHSLAASLLDLFYILAAAWPPSDQTMVKVDNRGLVNPTIRPILLPAVRLCLAMLLAVCGPAAGAASAPQAPAAPALAAGAASATPAPAAPAPAPTAPATTPPAPAAPAAPAAAATATATATEAASLEAVLLFVNTMANTLPEITRDWQYQDPSTAPFVRAALSGTGSRDGGVFQLLLSVLGLSAAKLHHAAGGRSVWGDDTPMDAHHLQLLQEVGLAPPPATLLASPDATPHPYTDDNKNTVLLTDLLSDVVNWNVVIARDAYWAAHPGSPYGAAHVRLGVASAMSLTLLELWALVGMHGYMRTTGQLLLMAQSSFMFDASEEQRPAFMQLLEAAWCKALPGAAASMQVKGRPLVYDGSHMPSFLSEDAVGEVFAHYAGSADGMCRQELKAFMAANPGAAAAGVEWGFRHLGRQLMQQPGPPAFNVTGDDPAEHVTVAWQLVEHLMADASPADTPNNSTTISTELQPALAAALATHPQDAQRLWLLLATLAKFAMAVAAERPEQGQYAAGTLHVMAEVAAAWLKTLPAGNPSRGPACMLLGRCLLGIGAAAAAAPAAEKWRRQYPSNCLAFVRLLGKELAAPGTLPAALAPTTSLESTTGNSSSTACTNSSATDNSSSTAGASSSTAANSSLIAAPGLLVQLGAQQAALEEALAAARKGNTPMQPILHQVQAYGTAVCALLPRPYCCNNPSCTSFAGHSEVLLGRRKCGACQAAAYCSRECQQAAWAAHRPVCNAMAAARPQTAKAAGTAAKKKH